MKTAFCPYPAPRNPRLLPSATLLHSISLFLGQRTIGNRLVNRVGSSELDAIVL